MAGVVNDYTPSILEGIRKAIAATLQVKNLPFSGRVDRLDETCHVQIDASLVKNLTIVVLVPCGLTVQCVGRTVRVVAIEQ